jgi:protein SCO1/2
MESSKEYKPSISNDRFFIGVLTFVALFILTIFIWDPMKIKPVQQLPFLGQCRYDTVRINGKYKLDTIHHKVQNFSFTDQTGKTITADDFKGKIYVADFFFTTCKNICPIMTNQMKRVVETYKNTPSVLFLSHTVFPEHDSVNVLAEYAKIHNADPNRWHFVTGKKKDLYDMARKSYLLSTDSGDGGKEDFVHTQMFALVDVNRHVRGFYNGTDSLDVNKLIVDIDRLLKTK